MDQECGVNLETLLTFPLTSSSGSMIIMDLNIDFGMWPSFMGTKVHQ
jgi:hypothetical protein